MRILDTPIKLGLRNYLDVSSLKQIRTYNFTNCNIYKFRAF